MSIIDLTKDLSNFNWTDYSKAGTGKSPQQDGTPYFERPNPKSLEQMESKFGPLNTTPPTRGPYGVADYMDGTKQGRGFIPPGGPPLGFTVDQYKSELEIDGNISLTPISHTISQVNSSLFYGQVGVKTLNLEPQAEGAYGVDTLPISTYTSRQELDDYTIAATGGNNNVFIGTPDYSAPSYLQGKFLLDYVDSEGVWPYKVLDFQGTHPLIRKEIGQRVGTSDEITLKINKSGDDFNRVDGWLNTSQGSLWITKQNILQALNPREETRDFSLGAIKTSIPSFIHATRHLGGGTYMSQADFGPTYDAPAGGGGGPTLGSIIAGKLSSGKLSGPFKSAETKVEQVGNFFKSMGTKLSSLDTALGNIDFNKEGKGGRLRFLMGRMIASEPQDDKIQSISFRGNDLGSVNLTEMRFASAPFGRAPKIPTNITFSQKGAFGGGDAHKGMNGTAGSSADQGRRGWISTKYNDLGHRYQNSSKLTPMAIFNASTNYIEAESEEELSLQSFDTSIMEGSDATHKQVDEIYEAYESAGTNTDKLEQVLKLTTVQHGLGGILGNNTGHNGGYQSPVSIDKVLGKIKGGLKDSTVGYLTAATDKINMIPYGMDNKDVPLPIDDFIKFKFKDLVNNKFIVFRALLSGISDSISPEWSGTQYIGRPDKVYVYGGAERKISFTFDIYPKTKQEFPVLLEKLNYLVGLCYPSYAENNRMIAPFINLTLGDMFKDTPGFLDSLSVEVNDTTTWEIDEKLQFPKHITCQCSFTYIGKYLPSSLGKHYELDWLTDNGYTSGVAAKGDGAGTPPYKGTFEGDNLHPTRTDDMNKLFSTLGADHTVRPTADPAAK
jgi:hypothetical protein